MPSDSSHDIMRFLDDNATLGGEPISIVLSMLTAVVVGCFVVGMVFWLVRRQVDSQLTSLRNRFESNLRDLQKICCGSESAGKSISVTLDFSRYLELSYTIEPLPNDRFRHTVQLTQISLDTRQQQELLIRDAYRTLRDRLGEVEIDPNSVEFDEQAMHNIHPALSFTLDEPRQRLLLAGSP